MKTLEVTLKNETGLHARPASLLTQCVKKFESEIMVKKDGNIYNPSSMLSILSMEAGEGTKLTFTFDGSDEALAYDAVKALIEKEIK
ncbi:MAG TPA: HPr family phosphocarrier protein [Clostridia bacterium]|nr:HPr family phosphocarrier protein [Clostridia bacterium]